jgi:type I restriction enzyme S subunit
MSRVLLKELCKKDEIGKYGIPASAEDFDVNKIRYLRISDIDDFGNLLDNHKKSVSSDDIEKYILKDGDLVIARTGNSTGRTYLHEEKNGKLAFAGFLIKYGLDDKKVIPKYLKYYTISNEYKQWVKNLSVGSTRGNINAQTFADCPIRLPKREQQEILVRVLSDLDAKIELNNKINRELEAMAKTLYDYWFVQFDFPSANGKPYKSSGGKMAYNAALKREIPEGWEVKSISSWIKKDKSGDWGKETTEGNYQLEVSCIRGADLNGLNGNGELKPPTRFILEKNSNKLLESHDLIVEISGGSPTQSTGRLGFITEETLERFSTPIICSNFCKALTLKSEKYLFNFVYQWNKLYENEVLFGWEGKTSGIKNLLFESFVTNHEEVYPPSELVEKFYDFAKPVHGIIQKNLIQNQHLSALRDWLLPMLMNGQVTVKGKETEQEQLSMAAEPQVKYVE